MLFILLSCAGVPGCGFFTWLLGYISNQSGELSRAFYLVLVVLISLDRCCHARERRDAKRMMDRH